jgi:hypothetical protein
MDGLAVLVVIFTAIAIFGAVLFSQGILYSNDIERNIGIILMIFGIAADIISLFSDRQGSSGSGL